MATWDCRRPWPTTWAGTPKPLLEIVRNPGELAERNRLLGESPATALHTWAASVAPHTLDPQQSPIITEYGGTTFRSQLEARWAAYFDKREIAWEYEPVQFNGWTPDFRLVLDGAEAYAEVKPVTEFPMDVAQRILEAGWSGDVLILGLGPRHAWRYRDDGWHPVDLIGGRGHHPATPQPPAHRYGFRKLSENILPRAAVTAGCDVRKEDLRDNRPRGNLIS